MGMDCPGRAFSFSVDRHGFEEVLWREVATHWTRLSCKRFVSNQVRLFAVNPAVAQNDATVTARDVVDRESLKAFVLEAREYLDSFETLSGYTLRPKRPRHGDAQCE